MNTSTIQCPSARHLTPAQLKRMKLNGITITRYRARRLAGWTLRDALTLQPGDSAKRYCFRGKRASLKEHCDDAGLNYWTVYSRIHGLGKTFEEAMTMPVCRPSDKPASRTSLVMQFLTGRRAA